MMSSDKPAVLMVGCAVPEHLMESFAWNDVYPQVQAHQHQWALIRGLEIVLGEAISLISVVPISDWPRNPRIYVKGQAWMHREGVKDYIIPFINFFGIKQISRLLLVFIKVIEWRCRTSNKRPRVALIYTSQSSQLWATILAGAFSNIVRIAILPDPPSAGLKGEGSIMGGFRKMDRRIQKFGLKCLDGVVVLAEALALDYAPNVPFLVSEGIATGQRIRKEPYVGETFVALYAGGMYDDYGVRLILDSLPYLPHGVEVWLFGRGPLLAEAEKLALTYSSLRVFGFRRREEIMRYVSHASVLLNPRRSSASFVRYTFPSKVLEAMASGVPLLSTRLTSIPDSYGPHVYWLENETPEGFAERLAELRRLGSYALFEKGAKAYEFVVKNNSERAQGERIWRFVRSLSRFAAD